MRKTKPLEEIRMRKLALKRQADYQMRVVENDLCFIKVHAGRLTLSGLGELFLPALANRSEKRGKESLGDYFSTFSGTGRLIASMMPTLIGVLSPVLLMRVIKKIGRSRKKR